MIDNSYKIHFEYKNQKRLYNLGFLSIIKYRMNNLSFNVISLYVACLLGVLTLLRQLIRGIIRIADIFKMPKHTDEKFKIIDAKINAIDEKLEKIFHFLIKDAIE